MSSRAWATMSSALPSTSIDSIPERQCRTKRILAQPNCASVLPNIYDEEQLREFCVAPETPPLTGAEMARVAELYARNFHLPAAQDAAATPAASSSARGSAT